MYREEHMNRIGHVQRKSKKEICIRIWTATLQLRKQRSNTLKSLREIISNTQLSSPVILKTSFFFLTDIKGVKKCNSSVKNYTNYPKEVIRK